MAAAPSFIQSAVVAESTPSPRSCSLQAPARQMGSGWLRLPLGPANGHGGMRFLLRGPSKPGAGEGKRAPPRTERGRGGLQVICSCSSGDPRALRRVEPGHEKRYCEGRGCDSCDRQPRTACVALRLAIAVDPVASHLALSRMKRCQWGAGGVTVGPPLPSAHSVEGPVYQDVGADPCWTHSHAGWSRRCRKQL